MTHGGKREGAGRKRSGVALINTSFRITPDNWAYLQTIGKSKGKLVNELLEAHRLKQKFFNEVITAYQSNQENETVPIPEMPWDGPIGAL